MGALVGRQIAVTLQVRVGDPSIRRLVAECADSYTVMAVPEDCADPIRELGMRLVRQHQALCAECRGMVPA